jgi:hypothetical protein
VARYRGCSPNTHPSSSSHHRPLPEMRRFSIAVALSVLVSASGGTLERRAPCGCPPFDQSYFPVAPATSGTVGSTLRCFYPDISRCQYSPVSVLPGEAHTLIDLQSHGRRAPGHCLEIATMACVVPHRPGAVAPPQIWVALLSALVLVFTVARCTAHIPLQPS